MMKHSVVRDLLVFSLMRPPMKWTIEFLFWWTPRRKKDAENKGAGLKRCPTQIGEMEKSVK